MAIFTQDLVTTLTMVAICSSMVMGDMGHMVHMEAMQVMEGMDPQRLAL